MSVRGKVQDVGRKVESCLKDYPQTRNDDTLLIWKVWEVFYGIEGSVTLRQMMELPSFETIRRTRAKIQNDDGKYLPSDETVRKRRGLEQEWRDAMQLDMFGSGGS
ncbi:MAG: hypothetical protein A3K57_05855 [Caulobacterales bacterium RIFOXYA1_FULL_67_7]|nr:MAG: hypothetical protein A3K57_05855 [Caulobacterales bacterium RIFOXYA1_FULL_67_7]